MLAASNLLDEFQNVFYEPQGLPPPRSHDHDINLLRGAAPVAVRPYRSSWHKDDLERQCRTMLVQSLICPSSSAFSPLYYSS